MTMSDLKKILLFGAGKSASVLIDYLIDEATQENWEVVIADANQQLVNDKIDGRSNAQGIGLDIKDDASRKILIAASDLVISMMPPVLHLLIANDCIEYSKPLLTASYVDDAIRSLDAKAQEKGLIFLCEMGLDPGIDHMSAMKLLDEIKSKKGMVTSFKSHCGGLVAPQSDNNPWRYKISWNPRNVVLAGKAGAIYLQNGDIIKESYEQLFDTDRKVIIRQENDAVFHYYPNRNSLSYIDLYQLPDCKTFVRTTLRYPEFMMGWNLLIRMGMTDETVCFESDNQSIKDFFSFLISKNSLRQVLATCSEKERLQLNFLGFGDDQTLINKGLCSPADVLQWLLETKLVLEKTDRDMIVMLHEIEYTIGVEKYAIQSSLMVEGKDSVHTAMAKTVGLPLGIAAKLILNGVITSTGVQIPTTKEIYEPVLKELEAYGVVFKEITT
jgi:saccharopine dehydrogenase-like NADP-dependent oxidoreductase